MCGGSGGEALGRAGGPVNARGGAKWGPGILPAFPRLTGRGWGITYAWASGELEPDAVALGGVTRSVSGPRQYLEAGLWKTGGEVR